jgi:hypothetical protein
MMMSKLLNHFCLQAAVLDTPVPNCCWGSCYPSICQAVADCCIPALWSAACSYSPAQLQDYLITASTVPAGNFAHLDRDILCVQWATYGCW